MSPAYIAAVEKALPDAILVFDRFHVIKLFNDKPTQLRGRLHRQLQDSHERTSLKGIRWLPLRRRDSLDPDKSEPERLARALELDGDLAAAYFLKEELSEIWGQDDYETAEGMLHDWIAFAESLPIGELTAFAKTLRKYALGILAYYDAEITTGPLEGVNNKIKTMKRPAYGFRNMDYFKLKILALHKSRYALVG